MNPLRGRERLLYNPHPQATLVHAWFIAVLSAILLVVGFFLSLWISLMGAIGLVLSGLMLLQTRWNARHPEVHTRAQRSATQRVLAHPVRWVVLSGLACGAALPAGAWFQLRGDDGPPPGVAALVVVGVLGAAWGAGVTYLHVYRARRIAGRAADAGAGPDAPAAGEQDEKAYRLAMSGVLLGFFGLVGMLPVVGNISAIVMGRMARRRAGDKSTRYITWVAEAEGWLGLLLLGVAVAHVLGAL